MTTLPFPKFHHTFPPDLPRAPYVEARHGLAAARVPSLLAEEWRSTGFGSYGNGMLWLMAPDEPIYDPNDWSQVGPPATQVLRSAWGDLWTWDGTQFEKTSLHNGKRYYAGEYVDSLFDGSLTRPSTIRDSLKMGTLFDTARKRLGDLAADECYGFAPMPALGGAMEERYLIKAKVREYVAMSAAALS